MSLLGKNIKHLRKQHNISQIELARFMKVSQTSIAHYEKGSRQPNIEGLINLSKIFGVSVDALIGNISNRNNENVDTSEPTNKMYTYLIEKDDVKFYKLLDEMIKKISIKDIIEHHLKEVLYQIGESWEQNKITEADEHYATNIVRRSMNALTLKNEPTNQIYKAIALTVHAEQHTLGIEMVTAFLESIGIESLYLGSNVPNRSLIKLIEDYQPDYVVISITLKEHQNSLYDLVDLIHDKCKKIIIGGQAVDYLKDIPYKNVMLVENMDQLLDIVN